MRHAIRSPATLVFTAICVAAGVTDAQGAMWIPLPPGKGGTVVMFDSESVRDVDSQHRSAVIRADLPGKDGNSASYSVVTLYFDCAKQTSSVKAATIFDVQGNKLVERSAPDDKLEYSPAKAGTPAAAMLMKACAVRP